MPSITPTDEGVGRKPSQESEDRPQRKPRTKRSPSASKDNHQTPPQDPAVKKYQREKVNLPIKSITDKKLKGNLRKIAKKYDDAAKKAAQTERLLMEEAGYLEAEGMERTYKLSQKELADHVDLNNQRKIFELKLDEFGPYSLDYTRNGRNLLIGGRKGHIATFNWESKALGCELHVRETIRDVRWLHNETMFAVAQKQFVYIYDQTGMEIHCLQKHVEGKPGRLLYQDTSTGQVVAEQKTRLGECKTMRQNPYNAILHLGHNNGTVTLWSPSVNEPVVKMLCHRGPVQSLAIDRSGTYMVTTGLDGQMKVWDVRTYKAVEQYFTPTPATTIDISQMGILAVGYGPNVTLWKDAIKTKAESPYMNHLQPGSRVSKLRFCPYEDVLGFGHAKGISSLVIPGSGEPNYDAMEANPFQTKKQRKTTEVHALLEKIQPEMISLDPTVIGTVDRTPQEVLRVEKKRQFEANNPEEKFTPRQRARGKSSAMRRYIRKQSNILDPKRASFIEGLNKERSEKEREKKRAQGIVEPERAYSASIGFELPSDLAVYRSTFDLDVAWCSPKMEVIIRDAVEADVPSIMEIQNWEILNNTAFADYHAKTLEDRLQWFNSCSGDPAKPLVTVTTLDGVVVGSCGLRSYISLPAFAKTVEIGLAIHRDYHRKGIGRKVVQHMMARAKALGYQTMLASICAENEKSLGLFDSLGFKRMIFLKGIMIKFDRDLDDIYMQCALQDGSDVKTSIDVPVASAEPEIDRNAPGYTVRDATEEDFKGIIEIYNWEISNGTLTGDTVEQSVDAAAVYLRTFSAERKNPLVVAVANDGTVAAYGHLPVHVARDGFYRTREISFFVHHGHHHTPVGVSLVSSLIDRAKSYGFRDLLNMPELRHANHIYLLQKLGFKVQGFLTDVGTKFDKSLNIVYLQLRLCLSLFCMDPIIRQLKLKQCITECKLDAALVALREAENIVPTLLAKEKYLSRKPRSKNSALAETDASDPSEPPDMSSDCCHVCGRSEGSEMMVCSNEKERPDEVVGKADGGALSERASFVKGGIGISLSLMITGNAATVKRSKAASRIRETYHSDDEESESDDSDNICAICNEHGELMCCDGCPAVFHIKCLGLDHVPDIEWFCSTCQAIHKEIEGNPSWRSKPVVLSLFDGIGAAYIALRRLGVQPSAYLSSEIDTTACEVLDTYAESHSGNVIQVGDVTKFNPVKDLPRLLKNTVESQKLSTWAKGGGEPVVDLLVGGSPCTDLSFLGQGAGVVQGEQSSFFFEYVRVLKETKPRWFLFENVRMRVEDMNIISKELGVKPTAVDSVDLSACRRNRLFWTNIPIRKIPQNLQDRPMTTQEVVLDEAIPEIVKAQCITRGNSSPHLGDSRFNVLWYPDGKRRSYHPVEIERLMGFPDFYTETESARRPQRHGMLGNSFNVYSVMHILGGLFKGDLVAEELQWKGAKGTAGSSIIFTVPHGRNLTIFSASGPKVEEDISTMKPLPPVDNKPSRLTIGERDKVRRVLRRLQKLTQHVSVDEVPDSSVMPGYLVPDYDHRYVVLVNDAAPSEPPSWSAAIIVPSEEWDATMPRPDPKTTSVVIRYFSNGAYGTVCPYQYPQGGKRSSRNGIAISNFRLLDPTTGSEPAATMERCLPGWLGRKDVLKAIEAAKGGRASISMRWSRWGAKGEVGEDVWEGCLGLRKAGIVPVKEVNGSRKRRTSRKSLPLESTPPPKPNPTIPTLASITARLDISIPELGTIDPDLPSHHTLSAVPKGGYLSIKDVEDDLRTAVECIVDRSEDDMEKSILEAFEKEWGDQAEEWLEEGSVVFVVPHKFMKVKDNQIWWPGMIIPLEELDDSIPVKSMNPGSYVVRYFEDNSCSVVSSKALEPFDPENTDPATGNLAKLMNRFGEQAVRNHTSIRKALRYVCTGLVPPGFPWALWGCSGLYRTGPPKRVEDCKDMNEGEDGRIVKKARIDNGDIEMEDVKSCKKCGVTETVCWRNGTDGFKTICNDCGLKLYLEMVPRVPVTELSNERFIESQDKSKNNSEHRYYTTRRPLPFPVWDSLGGGMLDSDFKLREGFTLPPPPQNHHGEIALNRDMNEGLDQDAGLNNFSNGERGGDIQVGK
ncbi:Small subunit (SSU) processome component [Dinochytrium kinnereticum]|nr:Small subunit (SSU) processome component [Dinochytrium kinnereticum]